MKACEDFLELLLSAHAVAAAMNVMYQNVIHLDISNTKEDVNLDCIQAYAMEVLTLGSCILHAKVIGPGFALLEVLLCASGEKNYCQELLNATLSSPPPPPPPPDQDE